MADVVCENRDCPEYGVVKTNVADHPPEVISCGECGYPIVVYTGAPPPGFSGGDTVELPPPLTPSDPIPPPDPESLPPAST
jgi:ribosomal protein S27AE